MKKTKKNNDLMPLNKYLSVAGVCSRRNAVAFIKQGLVQVNGEVVKEPGYKVVLGDKVKFKNRFIKVEGKIYILLNKPKNYITTAADEIGRLTVIDLVKNVASERIYPVGRLDKLTTGLILMTNDGDLSQRLSHPSFGVKKVYNVVLDRTIKWDDLQKIKTGVLLKDGMISADRVYTVPNKSKKNVRIQIHSGKNRVIRRIFKKLDYNVVKLDRINYAGLTKKGLSVGRYRFLTKQEVASLKQYGEVKKNKKMR